MIQIIPAILSNKESDFERDIKRYNDSELLQGGWVHIDFMDRKFVPNKSIGLSVVSKHPTQLIKEAHLMVVRPKAWVDKLMRADFQRIFFHLEVEGDIRECISHVKSKGMEVGLALNPETPVNKLKPFMDSLDRVLLMGIHPGFQGQEFLPQVIEKIQEVSYLRAKNNGTFNIGADGGVRDENAKELVDAGADFLVSGSFLLKGDIDANLEKIWEKISS